MLFNPDFVPRAAVVGAKVEIKNFDIFHVIIFGHKESATKHIYISQATDYYNHRPMDWISLTLKPSQLAGQRDQEKNDRRRFLGLLTGIPQRTQSGPIETHLGLQERNQAIDCEFSAYRFQGLFVSLSNPFFLFLEVKKCVKNQFIIE
jgi:hypothetical protein